MKQLVSILLISFAIRIVDDSLVNAVSAAISTALLMAICHKFGGWQSIEGMLTWVRMHPISGMLITAGTFGVATVGFIYAQHPSLVLISEIIEAYFFFHAICAIGILVGLRLKSKP